MKPHITDNESLHSFFSFVSKAVLIIPIFILIVSLFLKFGQPKKLTTTSNNIYEGQSRLTPTIKPITQNNSFKFDLKGPIVCEALFIKDKKVFFKNKLTNYVLNGDCLYTWDTGKLNGEKKCGLSNYVNMAENYLGLFNINDMISNNLVKDMIKDRGIDLKEIIKSCKRGEIKDKKIFEVPRQVIFKQLNG